MVVSSGGTVAETNHYYPFGGAFASTGNVQPYKYNGKELDTKKDLNWYDYGARHYDAALGRWLVVDPLAEKYYSTSVYGYCLNNPIGMIDEEGKASISIVFKYVAKKGIKKQITNFVEDKIERRLLKYVPEKMRDQFKGEIAENLNDIVSGLDDTWQEQLIEAIPYVGDVYGIGNFAKKFRGIYHRLQNMENKYVGEIADYLKKNDEEAYKKFIKNMRQKGVLDARRDQKAGAKIEGEIYKKGKGVDGHHKIKVSIDPSKATDPRNIKFMEKKEHIKLHQDE